MIVTLDALELNNGGISGILKDNDGTTSSYTIKNIVEIAGAPNTKGINCINGQMTVDIQNIVESIKTKSQIKNNTEIKMLCKIKRNKQGKITDKFHTTLPVLSKYEKTRIIGQRAKQIENGSAPFIKVHTNVIDAMLIAEEELKQKKI